VTQLMRPGGDAAAITQAIQSWGVGPDDATPMLRVGGIKMIIDGGFEGGYMRQPYEEPWGEGGKYRGLNVTPPERFTENVKAVNRLGWRVSTHAVGDAGIDLVLAAYDAANKEKSIVGHRWGIEHGFMIQPDQIPTIKRLGLFVSAQDHLYVAGPSLVKYWGEKRAAWVTPVKMLLNEGIPLSGGTDAAVVPYPPLWVIYHFVTRDTISGGVLGPDQKISREDALRLVTRNHWYLTFQEGKNGEIAPGRYADLVVLPEDIMTVPAKRIEQMKVMMTMVGGKVVYRNADFEKLSTQ